jgi:hypothetical protein
MPELRDGFRIFFSFYARKDRSVLPFMSQQAAQQNLFNTFVGVSEKSIYQGFDLLRTPRTV